MPSVIVHGHFYQPPRENPWTGAIQPQPSAAPFHDWNQRIHSECYGPNAFAHVPSAQGGEGKLVNNYANISFNFGPTLLSWLQENHPETYDLIIAADRDSALKRSGHGNAFAQVFGHAILPLCDERDLRTQIRWGLADFRFRFGREAEAIWLPETACNDRVLDALIEEGMRFVVLAPSQAFRIRGLVETTADEWRYASEHDLDTSVPYRRFHRGDRAGWIDTFFYNGATSRAIAFENLLRSSRELVDAFSRSVSGKQMMNVAMDGETFGHHFKFGDLCLAHALEVEAPARGFQVTNYGEFLDHHSPLCEVEISNGPDAEGTSWSCPHGVGRWIRNCGCQTGGEAGWNQRWRQPLRQALDYLRDQNIPHFEATRNKLFTFPWLARDESISLILDPHKSREQFLQEQAGRQLSPADHTRALTHLELQRMLLLMYTSCGWFFNDISGIETIQILAYAARAIDLMAQLNLPSARPRFLEILAEARSNRAGLGNGADVYRNLVEPLNPGSSGRPQRTAEAMMM
jgi:alpha-amylase/alpha-mannosidase (GH57 family)